MKPSPARTEAPDPSSWIPIESLESLPELEELLDPRYLVDSGQTRAVRMGNDGHGYVFVDKDLQRSTHYEKQDQLATSHRRWNSKKRSLKLARKVKVQRALLALLILSALVVGAASLFDNRSQASAASLSRDNAAISFVPTQIPIVVEGQPTTVLTIAQNLKQLVREQSLSELVPMQKTFDRSDFTSKRSTPAIEFRYQKEMTISVDGKTTPVSTTEVTVGDVLTTNGIVVDGDDIVAPTKDAPARGVQQIAVTRISTQTRTEEHKMAFSVERRNDPSMVKGKKVVKQQGVAGMETLTYTQTMSNGKIASEVISSRVTTKAPVKEIILVGTRNPNRESGKASFYDAPSGTCAHKSLPKGTIVTVTNTSNGKSMTCRVADRGPFKPGRIIDLSRGGFSQIASTSSGVVSVTLTW